MIPTLTTNRLTLRGQTTADAAAYTAFFADPDASGQYGGPLRADQAYSRMAGDLGHWLLKGFGKWMLDLADGTTIGGCGIVAYDGWPRHELTWWLLPAYRGQGYASEASRAAITFGYDKLGLDPVETHMRDDNSAARAIAERLGGTVIARETFPDGVARNIFALPRPEARP